MPLAHRGGNSRENGLKNVLMSYDRVKSCNLKICLMRVRWYYRYSKFDDHLIVKYFEDTFFLIPHSTIELDRVRLSPLPRTGVELLNGTARGRGIYWERMSGEYVRRLTETVVGRSHSELPQPPLAIPQPTWACHCLWHSPMLVISFRKYPSTYEAWFS